MSKAAPNAASAQHALESDWLIEVTSIGEAGLSGRHKATPEQCAALARDLDLHACKSIDVNFKVRSNNRGRYQLTGQITADVEQRCIVSLDPVAARLVEPLDIEFWPAEQLAPVGGSPAKDSKEDGRRRKGNDEDDDFDAKDLTGDQPALGDDPPEPIEHGRIALGRMVYELIAAGLDPYPKRPGAELATDLGWKPDADGARDNPFAALEKLKATRKPD